MIDRPQLVRRYVKYRRQQDLENPSKQWRDYGSSESPETRAKAIHQRRVDVRIHRLQNQRIDIQRFRAKQGRGTAERNTNRTDAFVRQATPNETNCGGCVETLQTTKGNVASTAFAMSLKIEQQHREPMFTQDRSPLHHAEPVCPNAMHQHDSAAARLTARNPPST
jgi:hypothetical protein